jgi:hypothetical protein
MHAGPCGACSRLREPGNARQGRVLVVVSVRPAGCHLRFERRDCRGARGEHRLGWSAIQSHRADEPHECRPPLALAQLVQCSVLGAAAVQQRDKMRGLESARVCAMQWRVLTAGWGLPCATESQACVCAAWTHRAKRPVAKGRCPGVPATASSQGGKRGQISCTLANLKKHLGARLRLVRLDARLEAR